MAHDNVPFIVARTIFEGNKADNKWIIAVKNQKNSTTLSQKDAVRELSQRHLHPPKIFVKQPRAFKSTEPDYSQAKK
jgi:hypothetical protein